MKYYLAEDLPEIIEKFFTDKAYVFFKKDGRYLEDWTYEELKGKYFTEIEATENNDGEKELEITLVDELTADDTLDTLDYGIRYGNAIDMVYTPYFKLDAEAEKITIE